MRKVLYTNSVSICYQGYYDYVCNCLYRAYIVSSLIMCMVDFQYLITQAVIIFQ